MTLTPHSTNAIAQQRQADFVRVAEQHRLVTPAKVNSPRTPSPGLRGRFLRSLPALRVLRFLRA